jgi:predicted acyl esterase
VLTVLGTQKQEDLIAMVRDFNNFKDYFEDKRVDFSKIDVPAYIGASYSTDIHTIGSLRAFEEIQHDKKWYVMWLKQRFRP